MCARSGRFHMGLSSALRHMLANWRASWEKENDQKKNNLKKEKNTELAFKGPREKIPCGMKQECSIFIAFHLLSSICICCCAYGAAIAILRLLL